RAKHVAGPQGSDSRRASLAIHRGATAAGRSRKDVMGPGRRGGQASSTGILTRGVFSREIDVTRHTLILSLALSGAAAPAACGGPPERLPMLTNEEAWKRLPGAPKEVRLLPAWARALAGPLPVTTARMLELDAVHRTGDRLDPKLRGLVRWAAADANRCEYARAVAAADLRRAGVTEAELQALTGDPGRLAPPERAAVAFARKMMRAAHGVTDEEVKQLLES